MVRNFTRTQVIYYYEFLCKKIFHDMHCGCRKVIKSVWKSLDVQNLNLEIL